VDSTVTKYLRPEVRASMNMRFQLLRLKAAVKRHVIGEPRLSLNAQVRQAWGGGVPEHDAERVHRSLYPKG
jgi:hypothetical protein